MIECFFRYGFIIQFFRMYSICWIGINVMSAVVIIFAVIDPRRSFIEEPRKAVRVFASMVSKKPLVATSSTYPKRIVNLKKSLPNLVFRLINAMGLCWKPTTDLSAQSPTCKSWTSAIHGCVNWTRYAYNTSQIPVFSLLFEKKITKLTPYELHSL